MTADRRHPAELAGDEGEYAAATHTLPDDLISFSASVPREPRRIVRASRSRRGAHHSAGDRGSTRRPFVGFGFYLFFPGFFLAAFLATFFFGISSPSP